MVTVAGSKVEIGAVTVPLRSFRAKPLATWGDDYLSREGADLPGEAVLLKWYYGGNPEPFTSAAEDSRAIDPNDFFLRPAKVLKKTGVRSARSPKGDDDGRFTLFESLRGSTG